MPIIVAIDFSDSTDSVLNVATEQAKAFGEKLYLIHVAEPDPEFIGYEAGPKVVRNQMAEHFHNEHRSLQELCTRVKQKNCKATALLIQGQTVEILMEQVEVLDVRMIIVGSHSHGNIYNLVCGSTTSKLLKQLNIPILIIPRHSTK
jgi:nucleotide-binding universal stress UspA family protein